MVVSQKRIPILHFTNENKRQEMNRHHLRRLCLPRLVALVEVAVIGQLNHCSLLKAGYHAVRMLEVAQVSCEMEIFSSH